MAEDFVKRTVKLIDRRFQYRLMWRFILLNTLMMIVFGGLLYIFFQSEISTNLATAHAIYRSVAQMLFPVVLTLSLLNIVITSILLAGMVIYSSHKIAGPLYRFNEALKDLAAGNLAPQTRIRDDDQLKPLAQSLDFACQRLSRDFSLFKKELQLLADQVNTQDFTPQAKESLDRLFKLLDTYSAPGLTTQERESPSPEPLLS